MFNTIKITTLSLAMLCGITSTTFAGDNPKIIFKGTYSYNPDSKIIFSALNKVLDDARAEEIYFVSTLYCYDSVGYGRQPSGRDLSLYDHFVKAVGVEMSLEVPITVLKVLIETQVDNTHVAQACAKLYFIYTRPN